MKQFDRSLQKQIVGLILDAVAVIIGICFAVICYSAQDHIKCVCMIAFSIAYAVRTIVDSVRLMSPQRKDK